MSCSIMERRSVGRLDLRGMAKSWAEPCDSIWVESSMSTNRTRDLASAWKDVISGNNTLRSLSGTNTCRLEFSNMHPTCFNSVQSGSCNDLLYGLEPHIRYIGGIP